LVLYFIAKALLTTCTSPRDLVFTPRTITQARKDFASQS